jgi:chemotaxis protein histidine kinase CheA
VVVVNEVAGEKKESWNLTYSIMTIILFLCVVGLFYFVVHPSTVTIALGASTASTILTGAAVLGIERLVEVIWWVVDLKSYMSKSKQKDTGETTKQAAVDAADIIAAASVKAALDASIEAGLDASKTPQVSSVAVTAAANAAAANAAAINAANATKVSNASENAKAPQDPRRLIISLELGVLLGLAVAKIIGINIFYGGTISSSTSFPGWQWGMAITGLMTGLVANPAHMVVRAIEVYKENSKNSS